MNRKKRISNKLRKNLNDFEIIVEDNSIFHKGHNNFDGKGETHILLKLKPFVKKKFNTLKIHRKVNEILKEEFKKGLHSLEIKIIS